MDGYEPNIVLALAHKLEKHMPLETRYTMKQTYAAAKVVSKLVMNTPPNSEEKKSTRRYPLIKITRAATIQDTVYIAERCKTLLFFIGAECRRHELHNSKQS